KPRESCGPSIVWPWWRFRRTGGCNGEASPIACTRRPRRSGGRSWSGSVGCIVSGGRFSSVRGPWPPPRPSARCSRPTALPLVGTRSVAASEHLSAMLAAIDLPHRVLNARQDKEEADIVGRAGELGRITVATNMAGRGTDIRLARGVAERGGLHVLATERHEAGRIDRQLAGRCGRQGDPGSHEAFVSLEDRIVA